MKEFNEPRKYPKDEEIKVEWTSIHVFVVAISFFAWPILFLFPEIYSLVKSLAVVGLQLGVVGVVVSSLKTPPYGLFLDGGEINFKKAKVEKTYFQRGMWLVATGFMFQMLAILAS